ncbi:MAG: acetyl-CoA carboxylase carboxyltransferase subunit beta [Pseudomonadota bacterium]
MNWLKRTLPRFQNLFAAKRDDSRPSKWYRDPGGDGTMVFERDLAEAGWVFPSGHHMRIGARTRLELLFDDGSFEEITPKKPVQNPLKFKDVKRYSDRLAQAREACGLDDAILVGLGQIKSHPCVCAAFDFNFLGGSMGLAVGEGIMAAVDASILHQAALIVIPSSGGARMQEGVLSLMQLPRTVASLAAVREAKLPYIVLLCDPTTGGVSASLAMLGDVHIAEPGAMIGFAGRRVIEQTTREELPPNFQTAEHLLAHGMVDMVVPRGQLRTRIAMLVRHLGDRQNRNQLAGKGQEVRVG